MSDEVAAIRIEGLSHSFKKHRALQGVSFTVAAGSIHGFVGPNGAGKTTTLKVLATLLAPQTGRVEVFGKPIVKLRKQVRMMIGYMPDHFNMYRQMTVQEYLDFFAAAYGLSLGKRTKIIDDVLALTDMDGRRDELIKTLSRGMQQRVSLARVLVNDPKLLLLDEPASGLDPRARIELMGILQELAQMGKTIFISSHILSELAELCDSATIIDCGQIKYSGSIKGLLEHEDGDQVSYLLTLGACHERMVEVLTGINGVLEVVAVQNDEPTYRVRFDCAQVDTSAILRAVLDAKGKVISFTRDVRHLNEAFMDLTSAGVRGVENDYER